MHRFKTYVADGSDPNGRIFAPDLNELQDLVAAIMDLTQVLGLGTLEIGNANLQLLRYGAGVTQPSEARISGDFRADGIVRGLLGLMAGSFSTVTRDAIPAGHAPNSLVIFNTTTNQYEVNTGNDGTRDWQPLGGAGTTYGIALPTTQIHGQEHILVNSTTNPSYQWRFRYNAASSSAYKWEFIGGVPMYANQETASTTTSGSYVDPTNTCTLTLPFAGDWELSYGANLEGQDSGPAVASLNIGGSVSDNDNILGDGYNVSRVLRKLGLSASTVVKIQFRNIATSANIDALWIQALPIRIA